MSRNSDWSKILDLTEKAISEASEETRAALLLARLHYATQYSMFWDRLTAGDLPIAGPLLASLNLAIGRGLKAEELTENRG